MAISTFLRKKLTLWSGSLETLFWAYLGNRVKRWQICRKWWDDSKTGFRSCLRLLGRELWPFKVSSSGRLFTREITDCFGYRNSLPRSHKQLLKPVLESSNHSLQICHCFTPFPNYAQKSVSKLPDQSVNFLRRKVDIATLSETFYLL